VGRLQSRHLRILQVSTHMICACKLQNHAARFACRVSALLRVGLGERSLNGGSFPCLHLDPLSPRSDIKERMSWIFISNLSKPLQILSAFIPNAVNSRGRLEPCNICKTTVNRAIIELIHILTGCSRANQIAIYRSVVDRRHRCCCFAVFVTV
jgi:hypothetical protein